MRFQLRHDLQLELCHPLLLIVYVYRVQDLSLIHISFASSSTLAKQVEEGAPADLFISASNKWMKYLSDKNLTVKETEKVLAGNELVLIAPAKSAVNSVDRCV